MLPPERLSFVTRHFYNLQSIRFAPLEVGLILLAITPSPPPLTPRSLRISLCLFLLGAAAFCWWSTVTLRRRYGFIKPSAADVVRINRHPLMVALNILWVAGLLWFSFFRHTRGSGLSDFLVATGILSVMVTPVLDKTNLPDRRIAYAIGLACVGTAFVFAEFFDIGRPFFAIAGLVALSLSTFDYWLLRQTFAEAAIV
jgi:hypothetical protein